VRSSADLRRNKVAQDRLERIFGKQDSVGQLQVSDARLLLLPVRCLGATFVWTTSPYVLRRFLRDAAAAELKGLPATVPDLADSSASVASSDPLIDIGGAKKLVLEDLDFTTGAQGADAWSKWLGEQLFPAEKDWQGEFSRPFAILDDKSFAFLAEFATEVNAHIRISEETGTVEHGALWYEETLPAETVLVSLFRLGKLVNNGPPLESFNTLLGPNAGALRTLQLGGNATTGQGLVRLVAAGGVA
jgi:CRISPR-associated protein Cmr4